MQVTALDWSADHAPKKLYTISTTEVGALAATARARLSNSFKMSIKTPADGEQVSKTATTPSRSKKNCFGRESAQEEASFCCSGQTIECDKEACLSGATCCYRGTQAC